jgi:galactose mutarotase-like enzyme
MCYDANDNVVSPMLFSTLVNGLRAHYGQPKTLLNDKGILALTNTTFADDAILIEAHQVAKVTLFDKHGKRVLTVSCPQADAFGLWAPNKPGYPFVCIEPWCGIADNAEFKGDISERDCIHSLESGKSFEFRYSITLNF